jgi:hypothetical protein
MCKSCVENGTMTQEELDEQRASGGPTGLASGGIVVGLGDAPDFIKNLFGAGEPKDPEAEAMKSMDDAVDLMLRQYKDRAKNVTEGSTNMLDKLNTPRGRSALAEGMAGDLMFRQDPAAIAYTLAVLTGRYIDLLDAWSTLYVKATIDDDDTVDLDSATTAEAKAAVTAHSTDSDHRTGMYL